MAAPVRGASSSTDSARQDMLSPEPSRSRLPHHRLAIGEPAAPASPEPRARLGIRLGIIRPHFRLGLRVTVRAGSAARKPPPRKRFRVHRPAARGYAEVWGSSPVRAGESCTPREQALRAQSGRPGEPHPRELRRPRGCYSWRPGRERPSVRSWEAHPAVEAGGSAPVLRCEPAVRAPPGLSPLPGSQL